VKHIMVVSDRTSINGSDEKDRINVNVGESIELICDASGVPVPVVTWSKDDQAVVDSSRVLDSGRRFFVASAQVGTACQL